MRKPHRDIGVQVVVDRVLLDMDIEHWEEEPETAMQRPQEEASFPM